MLSSSLHRGGARNCFRPGAFLRLAESPQKRGRYSLMSQVTSYFTWAGGLLNPRIVGKRKLSAPYKHGRTAILSLSLADLIPRKSLQGRKWSMFGRVRL